MDFLDFVGIQIPEGIAYPLTWLFALIMAIIIASKGKGEAEKFLLIACIIMFVLQLAMPFVYGLIYWLTGASLYTCYFYPILNSIGIVLLIIAFWKKLKIKDM